MTVKVAINGFGRIGRLVARARCWRTPRPSWSWSRSTIWPMRRRTPGCSDRDSVHGRYPGRGPCGRAGPGGRRPAYPCHRRARPRQPAAPRAGRRPGAGMHRLLHRPRRLSEASRRRCQESADLRAGQGRRPDRGLRRQPRQADRRSHDRLQCQLHHQLPRTGRQGAQRCDRHRTRADDHRPRLYQRPEDPRSDPPRPASRACGGHEHHPDHDGRGAGRRAKSCRS